MTFDWTPILGYCAGFVVTFSALGRVIRLVTHAEDARNEPLDRNTLLVIGNGLWTAWALLKGAQPVAVMCTLAVALNGTVLACAVLARRKPPQHQ